MKVAILVPRRTGMTDRDRLWAFCRAWWTNDFPEWEIHEGEGPEGPFCRSHAINEAAAKAGDWDVAVIIDADVLCDPLAVGAAVDLAAATNGPTLAYHRRVLLSKEATERVMAGFRGDWDELGRETKDRFDACSSAVVVSRELWDAVGGFDERFIGWGWEDVAFRCATETISGRDLVKIASTCWHLHHIVSSGNNRKEPTFQANKALGAKFNEARHDRIAMTTLMGDKPAAPSLQPERRSRLIPSALHRTVPAETNAQVEAWWSSFTDLHPEWNLHTWRDPLDPADWPETSGLWDRCTSGAQKAGLIRLEAIWTHGGVYVDSDVECYRPLDPLLNVGCFVAGWEDAKTIPDAVFAAPPNHPVTAELLDAARRSVEVGQGAWDSGPGVFTKILPVAAKRGDALLLPPGTMYPYHWKNKQQDRAKNHRDAQPWALMAHHWNASWLP